MGTGDSFEALNKLRDAFLSAHDGHEADLITDGILTHDEKLKIGRRILIANWILAGIGIEEISRQLRVGKNTVMHVSRRVEKYEDCFKLIKKRSETVEKEFDSKAYKLTGGSTLVHKRREHTGFKRIDVKRK